MREGRETVSKLQAVNNHTDPAGDLDNGTRPWTSSNDLAHHDLQGRFSMTWKDQKSACKVQRRKWGVEKQRQGV